MEEEKNFLDYFFVPLNYQTKIRLFLFFENKGKESWDQLNLIKVMLDNFYIEKYEKEKKESFIKKILTNMIYDKEIEEKAEALNIDTSKSMVVVLIETKENHYKEVKNFLKDKIDKDEEFLIELENYNLAMLKTIKDFNKNEYTLNQIEEIYLNLKEKVNISIGSFAENLKEIKKSFRKAKIAMEVEKIFEYPGKIANYDDMGIKRIIYKLPQPICESFLSEVLGKCKIKNLGDEALSTIDKFFENNLNISETSRKLFIHRNTLVYRLDKIKKQTGLDLRLFSDAIKFKIALMIIQYINFVTKEKQKI